MIGVCLTPIMTPITTPIMRFPLGMLMHRLPFLIPLGKNREKHREKNECLCRRRIVK